MKVGEFATRARASRLAKKAKFAAAFERARRDLRLSDATVPRPLHRRPDLLSAKKLMRKSERLKGTPATGLRVTGAHA
jgi:hypothetical protein